MKLSRNLSWSLLVILLTGCPSTQVVKNPGDADTGVRFYRSKPYLLLKPVKEDNSKVELSVVYMPDYSEEYSVHIKPGIGTNATQVSLNDQGVLTGLNVNLDSKTAENITAVGNLASNVGGLFKATDANMRLEAHDVPLGFYEAVIGYDGCKKRLYGWRYVGFMPFNDCPLEVTGGPHAACCDQGIVWGLVFEGNKLVFKQLATIASTKAYGLKMQALPQSKRPAPMGGNQ